MFKHTLRHNLKSVKAVIIFAPVLATNCIEKFGDNSFSSFQFTSVGINGVFAPEAANTISPPLWNLVKKWIAKRKYQTFFVYLYLKSQSSYFLASEMIYLHNGNAGAP